MKYLKKFKTNTDYILFKNSDKYITPNVCLIEGTDEVYYQVNIPPFAVLFKGLYTEKKIEILERDLANPGVFGASDVPDLSTFMSTEIILNDNVFDKISVTFGENISVIGESVFQNYDVPLMIGDWNNITTIEDYAFAASSNEPVYSMGFLFNNANSLVSIGECAFQGRKILHGDSDNYYGNQIGHIVIPEGVTTIGENAFAYTTPRDDVYADFFDFGTKRESFNLPNSVTEIGEALFQHSDFTDFILGNGLTEIPSETFSGCGMGRLAAVGCSVSNVSQDDSYIITIGGRAEIIPRSQGGIFISDSITSIGDDAFKSFGYKYFFEVSEATIDDLIVGGMEVVIGSGITSIGIDAFKNVPATLFYFYATTPPTLPIREGGILYPFPYWEDERTGKAIIRIVVPSDSVTAYKTAWPKLADYIFDI